VNWLAAALMSIGMCCVLIAIAQTTVWGWGDTRTLLLFATGIAVCTAWVLVELHSAEPLIDMAMMRVRGVWTTNLAAFLLGGGMYAAFIVYPQFAQLPRSTGFGFGASVVVSSLYLLPCALGMGLLGTAAGRVAHRFGSKFALLCGSMTAAVAFGWLAVAHRHPYDMLISSAVLGVGIGLAFAALGNLIVQAVPPTQTGVASGMNTVMRTLGGALGGQLSATFIVNHMQGGQPTVTGFVDTFVMATAFLVVCVLAGTLVPGRSRVAESLRLDSQLAASPE
jgi:MFS family permease